MPWPSSAESFNFVQRKKKKMYEIKNHTPLHNLFIQFFFNTKKGKKQDK